MSVDSILWDENEDDEDEDDEDEDEDDEDEVDEWREMCPGWTWPVPHIMHGPA